MLFNTLNQAVELGWDFYLPVIIFVVLAALAVPVWASIGVAAITMLLMSGDLPLALVGESLFDGIDAFALTAVPLFILTGDVLVRTGLSRKFLNVAEAVTQFAKGGFGSATVLVCGDFRLGRRRRRRRGADDHRSVGREWLSASLCLRSRCRRGLHRDLNSTLHCLYYYWSGAGYIRLNLIFSCADPRIADLNGHPDHQSRCQQNLRI